MSRGNLEDIILKAAQILGVDANTLDETEARKALRDNVMRTENKRIRKARNDTTPQNKT